ncbi:MAG: molybdenum cofactor biosynthesis protein MoaE [Candidatus Acidiferrales bacterium]
MASIEGMANETAGSSKATADTAAEIVELVREPIRAAELVAAVKTPGAGAVVVFDGIVRDNSKGRATLYLEYEAYEPMALRTLREIAAEMRQRFAVDRVALVHRLGRLEIGESSVLIAVSAAHRAAAFEACRFAIEAVKRSAPIWKKEYFSDGAVWVEGATPGPVSG